MIIFDEKKHAEKMLQGGFQTQHKHVYELFILSKYLFYTGLSEDEVRERIDEYCRDNIEFYNPFQWNKIINRTVTFASRSKLKFNKEVSIYKAELENIRQLDTLNQQKVAFILLVLAKFYDNKKFKVFMEDIFRLAKLNLNSNSKYKILHVLYKKGYTSYTLQGKIEYIAINENSEVAFAISEYEDCIYEYLRFFNEGKFKDCEVCGKTIPMKNNKSKYCKFCARVIKNEQNKMYYHLGK